MRPVAGMIRFVASPIGVVVPDLHRRLPGRGTWITSRRSLVERAIGRALFARSFKANVKAPAGLPAMIDRLLEQSALDALAAANRARLVVLGQGGLQAALGEGRPAALLRARDHGPAPAGEPPGASRQPPDGGTGIQVIETFTRPQLDLAFGRLNVVHATLLTGRASEIFLGRWRILESFRADEPDEPRSGARMTMLQNQDRND
jgi:predicted RNA-binding protein YlxR (DUF448 family)